MVRGGGTRGGGSRRSSGTTTSNNYFSRGGRRNQQSRQHRGMGSGIFTPRVSNTTHYHLHAPEQRTTSRRHRDFDSTNDDWRRDHDEEGFVGYERGRYGGIGSDGGDDCDCNCISNLIKCCCCCCGGCILSSRPCRRTIPGLLVLSLIVCAVLLVISSQNDKWILNAGESRRIRPAFLTSAVNVKVEWNSHQDGVDVDVYALSKCPPLTGPKITVNNQHDMTLGRGDYQYDYFYLNAGSQVRAFFAQTQGSSQVLLLRGKDVLSKLEDNGDDIDWGELDAIYSWYINSGSTSKTVNFRSDRTDVYILVYDNASSSKGQLSIGYSMDLTTYNLKGFTPVCSDAVSNGCHPVETKGAGCIIVDTTPGSTDEQGGETSLKITGSRNWFAIFLWSILPGALIVAWELFTAAGNRQGWQPLSSTDDDDEVIQSDTVRIPTSIPPPTAGPTPMPPPTAPTEEAPVPSAHVSTVTPSAPPTPVDPGTAIPIAEAHLIPEPTADAPAAASVPVIEVPLDQVDPIPVVAKK